MELTQHIENYKNTLNKTQQKQFDKILDVFKPLRPHTIHKVTKWIETNKTKSENTRANYYRFRDFLYDTCFDVLGYQKTIDNFTIGDTVFLDDCKNQKTISEFIITPKETLVIFDDHSPPMDSPTLIQQIRKDKHPSDQPIYQLPPTEVGGLFLSSVVKRLKADSLPKDSVLRPCTFYTVT